MSGSLTIPNVFAPLITAPVSALDQDFSAVAAYINVRQWTIDTIAARPATSVDGQGYFANDLNGGTPFIGDGAGGWQQLAPGLTEPPPALHGSIAAVSNLAGDRSGTDYSTTSATYVDVDATNLKASIVVPVGSTFALAMATYGVANSPITDGLDHVRIFGAGQPMVISSFTNNGVTNPVGQRTIYGMLAAPAPGPQDFMLQFRGDGASAFTIPNPTAEGTTGGFGQLVQPMLLVVVTS